MQDGETIYSEGNGAAESFDSPALEEKLAELSILKESLDETRKKASEYYDQLLRLKAEFENFRKRSEREKNEHRKWGRSEVLLDLIAFLDIFDQAVNSAKTSKDIKSVVSGIGLLQKEFNRFLKEAGIEAVKTEGEKFDPALHEAVEKIESSLEDGSIVGELQKGYLLDGKVVRPAKVKVAAGKKDKGAKTEK